MFDTNIPTRLAAVRIAGKVEPLTVDPWIDLAYAITARAVYDAKRRGAAHQTMRRAVTSWQWPELILTLINGRLA